MRMQFTHMSSTGPGKRTRANKPRHSPSPVNNRQASHSRFQIDNLAGEIPWKSNSLPATFTLADRGGSWWSAKLEPKGAASAMLAVNGISLEVLLGPKRETEFHLFLDGSVAELIC